MKAPDRSNGASLRRIDDDGESVIIRVVEEVVSDSYDDSSDHPATKARACRPRSSAATSSANTTSSGRLTCRTRPSSVTSFVLGGAIGIALCYVALSASSRRPDQELQRIVQRNSSSTTSTISGGGGGDADFVYSEKLNPPGTCILHRSQLPPRWRPPPELWFLPQDPWTEVEQRRANYATRKGVDELVDFYDTMSTERVEEMGLSAANSLMDQCISSRNRPRFHDKACGGAARVLKLVATGNLRRYDGTGRKPKCRKMKRRAKLLAYAHHLSMEFPGDSDLRNIRTRLVALFRASADECGGLDDYMPGSRRWEDDLRNLSLSREDVRMYVHYSNVFNELYTIPEIHPPEELDRFTAALWKFVAEYNFTNGVDVEDGYDDEETAHVGYLVTHIAYMPNGYDRHAQLIEDAPWLYEYIRRNFWKAMQSSDLDLFAEFVDLLRQYGCTEDNDVMVRDGSRFFLQYFKAMNFTWMPDRNDPDVPDYYLIHVPWCAIAALRRREVEPVVPGSYGYGFRKALERGAAAANRTASTSDNQE